ncbi:MAG: pyrophosphatase PpaX [Bacillota bacterium]
MKYKYILFDLDGTLIDTNRLIIDSFKHTYKTHLDMEVTEEQILKNFGEPLITTLKRYSEEKAEEMFQTYISFNEAVHDEYVSLCSGVKECLKVLSEMGCVMAVVTSKRKKIALRGLELFGIHKYFESMVAYEDTISHKPEPEPILLALKQLGADKQEALMIGDSVFDIQCARNAGVKSILVKWSAADGFQGEAAAADYVVHEIQEIVDIVR